MLIVDTNIWLAAADRHGDCSAVLRTHHHELAAPVPMTAETSWLILDRLGAGSQNEFLRTVASGAAVRPRHVDSFRTLRAGR